MNHSGIVIDLDTKPPGPPTDAAGSPRTVVVRRWRTAAAALAGILVLSAGGAAPLPEPSLWEIHAVPLGPTGVHHLAEGLLFTNVPLTTADQPGRRITGFDLTDGRRLWSGDFATDGSALRVAVADEMLLIGEELGRHAGARTTAVDLRTGRRLWSVPYWLRALPGEPTGLVLDSVFAPESRLTSDRPKGPSGVYHAADGYAYTAPPIGLIVRAVDLDTGRIRWESPRWDAAALVRAAGGQPMVLLTTTAGGDVEVRDAATGALRHRLDWPGGEPLAADRVGDVVAVYRSEPDPGVTAYSADLRQRLWSRSLTGPNPFVTACGPLLCQPDMSGTVAFDPATGETRWRLPEPANLISTGARLVELDDSRRLHRIIDPSTGQTVGDLDGWQLTEPGDGQLTGPHSQSGADQIRTDAPQLVFRTHAATQQTDFGLLDLAGPSVRPVGVLPYVLRWCTQVSRFLACRTAGEQLRVWQYE